MLLALLAGCGSTGGGSEDGPAGTEDAGGAATDAGLAEDASGGGDDAAAATGDDGGVDADAWLGSVADAGSGSAGDAGSGGDRAREWILAELSGARVVTGDFRARTRVETPALVRDATACCAKYGFDIVETTAPDEPRIAFVDVTIGDLVSSDAFGGGLVTSRAPGAELFLAGVEIEPRWPAWISYSETNKDGMVLDGASAIYGTDVTIREWNADSAIDNKALVSQFVRLTIEGPGNRALRYWRDGPHYLVESSVNNEGGSGDGAILWFNRCDTTVLNVYDSTFNGSPTVPSGRIRCNEGRTPTIHYLTTDPRTTGEMHEMFSP